MGNWRRVHLDGTCAPGDVERLREYLDLDFTSKDWGCLHSGGLAGLQNWASSRINAVGNLGERDFSVNDVADETRKIVKTVAPSLRLTIHCGGDYESDECIATILTNGAGRVRVGPPTVSELPAISDDVFIGRILQELGKARDAKNGPLR